MVDSSRHLLLFALVLVALVLRLGLMFLLDAHVIEDDWDFGYETGRTAWSLATGAGFSSPFGTPSGPTAWMMPGFPFLLAIVFKLFGVYSAASAIVILSFNCLVSALTCVPLFLLAERVFGRATAVLSGILFAVYPPSIWHAITTIWDTTLVTFCGVCLLFALYRLGRRPGLGQLALYGAAMGAVAWINPLILAFLPFVAIWIGWRRKRPASWRLAGLAVTLAALCLVLSPWLVRNYLRFDRLFLRSNLGLELRLGNSDEAWADYRRGFHTAAFFHGHPSLRSAELERYVSLGEARYMEEAFEEAARFILRNPGKVARMTLRRIRFFWIGDLGATQEWAGNLEVPISLTTVKKLVFVLPVPFMLLGIFAALKDKKPVGPLIAFLLLLPIAYYLTHVSSRYRFPVEPCMVLFVGYALKSIAAWSRTG